MPDALVLGGGPHVWDEVIAFERLYGQQWDGIVIAANDVGVHWPRDLHHWCSLHPDKLVQKDPNHPRRYPWVQQRMLNGFSMDFVTWSRRDKLTDRQVQPWGGGSSGLLAVAVAFALEAPRIILCGVPMTKQPHFEESGVHNQKLVWASADNHWRVWQGWATKMQGRVRSMSGRTQELLGMPDSEWLGLGHSIQ